MASKQKSNGHGNDYSLEAAMAMLIQNQAAMTKDLRDTQRENAERFARIEAILMEHSRLLRALPEAVREKIGFKAPTG
jgi:hypothetical protein